MTTTTAALTQDEILTKLYTDMTRLAGEIAIDRCRTRVLLRIVKEKVGMSDEELDGLFRDEVETNLETFVHDIMDPMVAADEPPAGCCGGRG